MEDIINYIEGELQEDGAIPMYEIVRRGVFAEHDYLSVTAALWEMLSSGTADCIDGYILLKNRQPSDINWGIMF